jgi:RNA polymerase sigma-70 factor (ECF subfamily)
MTDRPEQDDLELVRKCLSGDVRAFEYLVDRYQKTVFNAALRIMGSYQDAEDATQSTFLKAYENLKSFNPKYKFFSWLYKIAVNESLNSISQRKQPEELDEDFASRDKTPEEIYRDLELTENIQDALMGLEPEYRIIVILKHFHEFSYKEIGQILDLSEKTIKSRLFTARQLLRNTMLRGGI